MPTCTVNSPKTIAKCSVSQLFFFFYHANLLRGCFIKVFLNLYHRMFIFAVSGSRQFI